MLTDYDYESQIINVNLIVRHTSRRTFIDDADAEIITACIISNITFSYSRSSMD